MTDYKNQINIVIGALKQVTSKQIVALTLDITANLRQDTPRLTGWAASNWIPTLYGPQDGVYDNPNVPGSGSTVTRDTEQQAALSAILRYQLDQGPIYISNNVPYIIQLNEGSSLKAPAKFVERAVQEAVDTN